MPDRRHTALARAILASLVVATASPVQAQSGLDLFMGVLGAAIEEQRRGEQRTQEQRRAQQARQAAETALVRRAQTALSRLGFYTLGIDGSAGPGTRAAVGRYEEAFRRRGFSFSEPAVAQLERDAASGFRSLDEIEAARRGGFADRTELVAARAAGFRFADEWREAQRLGIDDPSALMAFRESGFASASEFREASRAGFASRAERDAARALGLSSASEVAAFLASGLADPADFRARQAARDAVAGDRGRCLADPAEEALGATIVACDRVLAAIPDDAEAEQARDAAVAALDDAAADAARILNQARDRFDRATPPRPAYIERAVDRAEARSARVRAMQAQVACRPPSDDAGLAAAIDRCRAAAADVPAGSQAARALADLEARAERAAAEAAAQAEREAAEAEARRRRIAETEALERGAGLLSEIATYVGSGQRFGAALDIARATASLQVALDARDGPAAIRALATLDVLLDDDGGLAAWRAAAAEAETRARAEALRAAREDLGRYVGFLEDFLGSNILDPRAAELIGLVDAARHALAEGAGDLALDTRETVRDRLAALRLLERAQSHRLPGDATADAAASQDLTEARAREAAETAAAERAGALLDEIAAFLATGSRFDDALAIARDTGLLRRALDARDGAAVARALADLERRLEADGGLASHRAATAEAEALARAQAAQAADRDLARFVAFIETFLTGNVLDPRATELLSLVDQARAARGSGSDETVLDARRQVGDRLASLGLGPQAAAFRLPDGDAAAAQQARLADAATRDAAARALVAEARAMMDDVSAFVAAGNALADPLALARAMAPLRDSAALADGAQAAPPDAAAVDALAPEVAALRRLLDADTGFVAFRETRARDRALAQDAARRAAAEQAEALVAFAVQTVADDPLHPEAARILGLADRMRQAIARDDAGALAGAVAAARADLAGLRLADAFDQHLRRVARDAQAGALAQARGSAAAMSARRDAQRAEAETLLSDVAAFADEGGRLADPIALGRGVSALRRALADETQDLAQPLARLGAVLEGSDDFRTFRDARQAARDAEASDRLAVARARGAQTERLVVALVADDPLRDGVDVLLDLQDALAAALGRADAAAIETVAAQAEDALTALGLGDALNAFRQREAEEGAAGRQPLAPNGLALTALNAALLQGDARDLLVLANRRDAPNLTRDLLGRDRFEAGRAVLCWGHAPQPWSVSLGLALNAVDVAGGRPEGAIGRCDETAADLVLVGRGAFLGLSADQAQPLVTAFEAGDLSVWADIRWADVEGRAAADAAAAARFGRDLAAGVAQGWGLVTLDPMRETLCVVDAPDRRPAEAHLDAESAALRLVLPGLETRLPDTAERVFALARRGDCAAIWASAGALATLVPALARDSVAHAISAFTATPAQLDAQAAALDAADADAARAVAETRERIAGDRAVAEAQEARAAEIGRAEEQRLRDTYGQEARAAQDRLAAMIAARIDDGRLPQARGLAGLFPAVETLLRDLEAGGWRIESHRTGLVDYGTAEWGGRRVEAVVVEMALETANPLRGQRDAVCRRLAVLLDDEFGQWRDPATLGCADEGALADWLTGRGFETRWRLP